MSAGFLFKSLYNYERRISSVVEIGDLPLGGTHPIRIQSMTNTPTLDTFATVQQCKNIFDAGSDYVRITTPAIRDAENLVLIKKELHKAGYKKPLIADVHFNPAVAEVAARIVEKVRINPGNYADKKQFEQLDFTDLQYRQEIERIHKRLIPLIKICKEYGTAVRIGVNHGSLSDRIMSRYGDTPEGMAESAMEFLRIFEAEGFRKTVISMKSSNTRVMVYSTRLLVKKMMEEGMNYPLHLGVTEAGEGEDGIIKSAVGIGALLADGIGDTIRVSLTGDPEQEIPVAKSIVAHFNSGANHNKIEFNEAEWFNPFDYKRRSTIETNKIGGNQVPKVVVAVKSEREMNETTINQDDAYYLSGNNTSNFSFNEIDQNFVQCQVDTPRILVLKTTSQYMLGESRAIIARLNFQNNKQPIVFKRKYSEPDLTQLQIKTACDYGGLLIDGFVDGLWIENSENTIHPKEIYQLSLNLLQAGRLRTSKTEYISCPSCGRTLFDLTSTTALIRSRTSHLKHLKIGIMGCIVNGPGEMADADYGYVGTGVGKITLYKGKEVVKRNINANNALDELISLIKANGDWIEP